MGRRGQPATAARPGRRNKRGHGALNPSHKCSAGQSSLFLCKTISGNPGGRMSGARLIVDILIIGNELGMLDLCSGDYFRRSETVTPRGYSYDLSHVYTHGSAALSSESVFGSSGGGLPGVLSRKVPDAFNFCWLSVPRLRSQPIARAREFSSTLDRSRARGSRGKRLKAKVPTRGSATSRTASHRIQVLG